ncbi:Emopamil-binding protein [Pseudovirgaria hyperparasitica]|uniref:Emopamil-binding protein n=1 Tax=Pseudovirgaria hyperparasitica TaxID=470096 RepID=A0A6A6WMU5_9PEZI|nr:Emopamil-binding protein [Pseudovirgaria hyperparasitica]KAF2763550.1 Emopamil-binding protein [Pseudovirgaria hyperparasitica]
MSTRSPSPSPYADPQIDTTTVLSLLTTVAILAAAYATSTRLLPSSASTKTRILFVWHAFDALIHTFLEGTFLLNCFLTSVPTPPSPLDTLAAAAAPPSKRWFAASPPPSPAPVPPSSASSSSSAILSAIAAAAPPLTPPGIHFLADAQNLYGSIYGTNPAARLWQEYAKADRRWGGADLTIVSLELLTVCIGAPLAAYICVLLVRGARGDRRAGKGVWFWMGVLATGELYGGFMTFAPEWLSGCGNLETGNWLFLWVYLTFFNMLWVVLPVWILVEAYRFITAGLFSKEEMVELMEYIPKKDN